MDKLDVYYQGERVPDLGSIAADALVGKPKVIEFTVANDTDKPAENLRLGVDLPKEAYGVTLPRTVAPGRAVTCLLKLDTDRIFEMDDLTSLALELRYDLIKVIED